MAMKAEIYVQYDRVDVEQKQLLDTAKNIWTDAGNRIKDLKELKLYVKPAEYKCYYTMDGMSGSFDL